MIRRVQPYPPYKTLIYLDYAELDRVTAEAVSHLRRLGYDEDPSSVRADIEDMSLYKQGERVDPSIHVSSLDAWAALEKFVEWGCDAMRPFWRAVVRLWDEEFAGVVWGTDRG